MFEHFRHNIYHLILWDACWAISSASVNSENVLYAQSKKMLEADTHTVRLFL